ncbi:MAG: type II toxin-antitoxin system PemK/MazF family toxin [Bacillota bacterium]|jgi:mRNA interferase MazF
MIARSEIWDVRLSPTEGAEMQKIRPCVVVSSDHVGALPLKIVVPVTGWKEAYANRLWLIRVSPSQRNGLEKLSAVDAFQVRSVSEKRFVRKRGHVTADQMDDIVAAIGIVLEINSPDV